MEQIDRVIDHAEQHCKSNGSRLTLKRKRVLAGLLQSEEKALSAYELIEICKDLYGEALPAMSMYRILEFLENEKLIHKLKLANKYVACAHITCDHAHAVPQFLICGACQKVKEVSIPKPTIKQLEKNIEQAGFQLVSPQLEMNCICSDCMSSAA